jgi:predicted MPP superfamily phosphohydrolase
MARKLIHSIAIGLVSLYIFTTRAHAQAWTLVLLPDTQNYTYAHPEVFMKQTRWIAENKETRNIKLVLHTGDITHHNTRPEWLNARHALDTLASAGVPFVLVTGNHDTGVWGSCVDRSTFLNEYFGTFDYNKHVAKRATRTRDTRRRGVELENAWNLYDTPWGAFMVLALEYLPRNSVVAWADNVLKKHPGHHVLLLTHSYLSDDNTRSDWRLATRAPTRAGHFTDDPDGYNDGEALWQKLVSRHRSFLFTFSSHLRGAGTGYLVSKGISGNEVHQMAANYQKDVAPDGGEGYLRLLEFQPDRQTIKVSTYSPHLDQWLRSPGHDFVINLSSPLPPGANKK